MLIFTDTWKRYPQQRKGDYEREDGIAGCAWISRYTLQFLDAYLKHEEAAAAFLKKTPAENGVPKHFMTVNYHAAESAAAHLELAEAYLKSSQKQLALESYQKALERDPGNEEIKQKLKDLQ